MKERKKCVSSDTPRNDGGGGAVGKVCVCELRGDLDTRDI